MCLSLRRHKRANVFGVLKMYNEMTQLGPHSFCMSSTWRDFIVYMKNRVTCSRPKRERAGGRGGLLKASQFNFDTQTGHCDTAAMSYTLGSLDLSVLC